MVLIITFVLGSVDFLFAFYRWNTAGKAVQLGARIAAVSDPVATGLSGLSADVVCAGDPTLPCDMPSFTVTCPGNATSCTCTGFCTGIGASPALDQNALNTIVYGRGSNPPQCGGGAGIYLRRNVLHVARAHSRECRGCLHSYCAWNWLRSPRRGSSANCAGLIAERELPILLLPFGSIAVRPSSAIPTPVTGEVLSSVAQCSWGPC